ncbi:MFS transporter [Thermoproteus tenax]|uniref:Permease, multidrug efflux n=1 Tax=Thermoproteus tenax (strain ATCC 35583 / DSM 2078 / JCM 9277 / NBRC 100435 / Kra 1) TaxID=768679 RepID=G4RNY8_THETK|nr:MFS transporter [Thermoproteus tenax]CCC81282.1 permease, multidrug efflux [Thermoproteus tenax Kra 1]
MEYKRAVLLNSFIGAFMASMNISALVIALPAVFRGIDIDPFSPLGFVSMLWLILAYPFTMAIFVAIIGRLSDMYGKGRVFTLGALTFTVSSLLLGLTPGSGAFAAALLVAFRVLQGIGGSMMFSNSAAIIADVFPPNERGFAQGVVGISFSAGSIAGLLVGGALAVVDWRLVFLVNVPLGLLTTLWSYRTLFNLSQTAGGVVIDWLGASILAAGLLSALSGLTLSMMPYGGSMVGWGNPAVWALIGTGIALLALLIPLERRAASPMLRLDLFSKRQFSFGVFSAFLLFLAQGANIFVLSIFLQAVYLPMRGMPYEETPLWAGIYLIPNSVASALFAPIGGKLLNKLGARTVSTLGAVLAGIGFELLAALPLSFAYSLFAAIIALIGTGFGLFMSPNLVSILSSVPSKHRGAASGIRAMVQNVGTLMSFAIFMTLIIAGSAPLLAPALYHALLNAGVPSDDARSLLSIPPVVAFFAAFLGYNPIGTLVSLAHVQIGGTVYATITEPRFFADAIAPALLSGFHNAYHLAAIFAFAAAVLSALRGRETLLE